MAALAGRLPRPEMRLSLLENVHDEHGEGNLSLSHERTFLALLEGLGLSANPPISTLVPYLSAVPAVAGGAKSLGGGIDRLRLVAKLQKTG